MTIKFNSYESLKEWKNKNLSNSLSNTHSLNNFHDEVMKEVYKLALTRLEKELPPCKSTWFITGSGGRYEQGVISDQDQGIVYEETNPNSENFYKLLGEELSFGLNEVGYPYCQGNVMSSNSLWCKSVEAWKQQLFEWMEEGSLNSIRNLQIFYDARMLTGQNEYIYELKSLIHEYCKANPILLKRFMESVMHIKNAIGPLGQIIVETNGIHQGSIDLKYSAFIPYVNAIRILSIKEGIHETSTIDRINCLISMNKYKEELQTYKNHFEQLLEYRLSLYQIDTYEDTHYLNIKTLTKEQRKEIKKILKEGRKLHQYVNRIIEKGCS
ncbi:DUF294 nucleotidyltransferase-like domain-containing protein [Cytobacillus sp. FJAT-54145]|uniref:DUF294 nucleotidyltransferase-like domain-containing protein n=1 Tax=Cytobacillus spartinae TaxID=3299023 RepID=A0ABW6K5E6_9BACI